MSKENLIKKCSIILLIISIIMIILCLNNFIFFLPDDFNDEINVSFLLLAPIIAALNSVILFVNRSFKKNNKFMAISIIINYIPIIIWILGVLQWGSVA